MTGVYSVTQINAYIKNLLVRDLALSNICIRGEVSNCKYHSSGHIYFTLKDAQAAIACVMFASRREGLTFRLSDGQSIEARGQISVYEKTGTYQLYVRSVALSGQGLLYERFLQLKQKLLEMGMFDKLYKKPIPRYAMRIGIVTAPQGAAIQDICNISRRRNPYVQLILCPALVQGEGAKESIVRGIERLDRMGLDVLIVGRGGGSIEDLWAFNEEVVARAIFDARTPVISAVGHETDVTIADYVADLRAPTPSAAAELANFDYEAFSEQLSSIEAALTRALWQKLREARAELSARSLRLKLQSPGAVLARHRDHLAAASRELDAKMRQQIEHALVQTDFYRTQLSARMETKRQEARHRLSLCAGRLDALSPLRKISGGYGYVTDAKGHAVCSAADVKAGDALITYLADGRIKSIVESAEADRSRG